VATAKSVTFDDRAAHLGATNLQDVVLILLSRLAELEAAAASGAFDFFDTADSGLNSLT
jgi:hypothetical protein